MAKISSRISTSKVGDRTLNEDDGDLLAGTMLLSYHSWGARDLSPTTTLAIYIAL